MTDKYVTIYKDDYEDLIEDQALLEALIQFGVKDWPHYDKALESAFTFE